MRRTEHGIVRGSEHEGARSWRRGAATRRARRSTSALWASGFLLAALGIWAGARAIVQADRARFALRIDRTVPLGLPGMDDGSGTVVASTRSVIAPSEDASVRGQLEMVRTCVSESGLALRLDRCWSRAGLDAPRRARALLDFVAALAELRGLWEVEVLRAGRANPMMLAQGDVLFSVLSALGVQADVRALRLGFDAAGASVAPRATCRYAPGSSDFAVDVVTREGCLSLSFPLALAPRGTVRRLEEVFAPMLHDLGAVSASGAREER